MSAPQVGQLGRAVAGLTIGTVQRMGQKEQQRSLEGLMEREQQYQIDISGRAEEFTSWDKVHLVFDTVFVDATGQRDSDFERPVFLYGSYVPIGGPVGVLACVTVWDVNDKNETTGCTLQIGTVASDVSRKFHGELHAVFQGYGMPADDYGDMGSEDQV